MFEKKVNKNNTKECFNFLKDHFSYSTLNSWNGLYSIANNVKVYNLKLEGDCYKALSLLEDEEYSTINYMMEDFERKHKDYRVGFNGSSGGYIVIYNKENNCNILPTAIADCEDYEDFKTYCKEYYGGVKGYKNTLLEYVDLVCDFDKLCDDLRDYTNDLSKLDAIRTSATNKIDNFNDEYYDELKEVGYTNGISLDENHKIDIRSLNNRKSLLRCLLEDLKSDVYNVSCGNEYIELKDK